jgi:hypothetical protein
MFLKPKSTTKNNRALLYRRFIGLEKSASLETIYKTIDDDKNWIFDALTLTFTQVQDIPTISKVTQIRTYTTILLYQGNYFRYNGVKWEIIQTPSESGITLLSATFNNVAKYQTNKYYYVGSFDFMIKGTIESTETQPIKGLITPMRAMNIRTFADEPRIDDEDLVVVDKHLYSVESPEISQKRMPKPFNVYFCTLNNIL